LADRYRAEIAPFRIVRFLREFADAGTKYRAAGFVAVMAATRISSPVKPPSTSLKGGDRAGLKKKSPALG
jgi:hypothetical protein